jgi:peptide/nickel transport system substrate-binding protein
VTFVDQPREGVPHRVLEGSGAWNNLDRLIAQRYFPLFPTWYGGRAMAHGSKIQGDFDDNTVGMPTWKDIWISQ